MNDVARGLAGQLRTGHGALRLGDDGRVNPVGPGEPLRRAGAGDGLASELLDAILAGSAGTLDVAPGTLSVIRSAEVSEARPVPEKHAEAAIDVDMTNWSVRAGEYVVKVVSEWASADRAARILEHLGAVHSPAIPRLVGRIDWHHPARGTAPVILVSEFVPGVQDGWSWAVADVLALVNDGVEPRWPAAVGAVVARLHSDLLTMPTRETPPLGGAELRKRAQTALEDALLTVTGPAAVRLRNRAAALRAAIVSIPDDPAGPMFEGHGDLHVGQVLRTPDPDSGQYLVIDFDGDPQLHKGERERPENAARDLAHLLTSVDLVASIAQRLLGSPNSVVTEWSDRARSALLESYLSETRALGHPGLLDERLLEGFEAEQFARELLYASRYLPRWEYAPDGAIARRYAPDHDTTEEEWTPPDSLTT